jgi:hypothetical protein
MGSQRFVSNVLQQPQSHLSETSDAGTNSEQHLPSDVDTQSRAILETTADHLGSRSDINATVVL